MFSMFNQAFAAITILFAALENFAKSLLNVSEVTEAMSGSYRDEQIMQRKQKAAVLAATLEAQRKQIESDAAA